MQGLGPIFDPRSSLKRKCVWFTIVFVAILFTTFNIYTQIVMYVDRPITVRVDFKKASDLQFPSITICNNNFAAYNATAGFVNGVQTLKIVKPLLFTTADNSSADFSAYNFTKYHIVGWEVFFALLSQDMNDMLLMCKWEQSPCSLTNFTPVFTDMGLCYSFNVNGSLAAREAGRSFGLKLTLDAKQDDYLRSMDHYYGAGFRVVVHAPGVPPIMSERGVAVSPGLHNFLAIDVKQLKNAEPSISQCGSKELKYYRTTYSTEACRLECRTDVISDTCGCRDLYMPNTDVRICDPPEFHTCLYPTLDEYLKSANHCEDLCPEPCQENLYRVTPSSNPLSDRFLDEFSTVMGQDPQYWRSNLVHLEIYLTSMTYEKVEKQLGYTLLQLFCDVGGAFGLLLGASILTLLEIVDFFLCRISAGGNVVVNSAGKR
ncbi:acid-sensing ion channel 3-like [Littorina saxatilis]|uniref:acid-sensing ion channel 3-like n=1 Tax=Littorina saxatilis TaxID=31220 RepID=UPI0038B64450